MRCTLLLASLAIVLASADRRHSFDSSSSEDDDGPTRYYGGGRSVLDQFRDRKVSHEAEKLTGQELVDYVNRNQNLWRAKLNKKFMSYSDRVKYGLMGVNNVRLSVKAKKHLSPTRFYDMYIPEAFDAREKWDMCPSLKAIRDQSSCGSCWAFGAVEAMSDRICIASHGKIQVYLSADDLLSCCGSCGFGCYGGDPMAAWKYWVKEGIVTGSNFTIKEGCKPYPFPPCEHHSNKTHYEPCKHDLYPTPKCERKCVDGYSERTYEEDKFYGLNAYGVDDDVTAIQKEILSRGPVEVAFEVYEDFLMYDGGVYVHTGGKIGGGHAVKMLGWGVEQGVPYWLVANSWNTDWGEDGFFRILRGVDECGIESGVVGGLPKLNRVYKKLNRRIRLDDDDEDFFF
ncbi:Cathepsin B-like cysteine proteinase 6 [Toxocara canis]|uniref:Cathepsin B-like cysteine proteinase 6 n=1 Tax=Toxocara canis TaxID=6265 RepID=A0A0B2VTL1_TOXCA|nr:Cathepsin B-like cysteine proteinase 6 [Toxocara canis]